MTGARFWPAKLSQQIQDDRQRTAEVKVYNRLKDALPEGWIVFYSRPWLGLTSTGKERDGECDFVVAHPEHGVVAIEVKGGGIAYLPESDTWTSTNRDGIEFTIKNPIEQAKRSKHEIHKKIQDMIGPKASLFRFRHGVIFPDVVAPPAGLGADKPRELFCCRADMPDILGWIEQRLSGGSHERGPGAAGISALEKLLARPIKLRVPLAHVLEDDDSAIAILSTQQFHLLEAIADLPRVAAGGGAGTGKTVLACEDALRLSEAGLRTLLTCRGKALAEHLKTRFEGSTVEVFAFEDLCIEVARRAQIPVSSRIASDFLDSAGPDLLIQAVDNNPDLKFDAIVVDEAQDFKTHWWVAIDSLLREGASSRLHAFFDTNQMVYGPIGAQLASFSLAPIRLTRNLRNTQKIHAVSAAHYQGPVITPDGPEGISVEVLPAAEHDVTRELGAVLRRLTGTEGVKEEDIAVLVSDSQAVRTFRTSVPSGIALSTIGDFKGLERPVVVVVVSRSLADQVELAYVASSRARTHLVLLGERIVLDWLVGKAVGKC